MQTYQASCIFDGKATLAEGPGWDEERQAIVWVDIEKGKVSRFYPSTHRNETWAISQKVGCIVRTSKGDLLAGGQEGLLKLNPESGEVTSLQNPEPDLPVNRFNDGKCDPQGRLWAGTMSCEEEEGAGSLYRITNGSRDILLTNLVDQFQFPPESEWNMIYDETRVQGGESGGGGALTPHCERPVLYKN